MKIDFKKIMEIYGTNSIYEFKENIEDVEENINYLIKLGFKNVYEIVELYPYMFLMCEDLFKEKVNILINNLGMEYLNIFEENTTLWGGVESDK